MEIFEMWNVHIIFDCPWTKWSNGPVQSSPNSDIFYLFFFFSEPDFSLLFSLKKKKGRKLLQENIYKPRLQAWLQFQNELWFLLIPKVKFELFDEFLF